jgi:hypothetical protein
MTREEFDARIEEIAVEEADLLRRKSRGYGGSDPLKNWRKRGLAGLLVRLEDKLCRYDTFLERGGETPENWHELLRDIAGYALCGMLWLEEGDDENVKEPDE